MVSGISPIFLSPDPIELCYRLKLLLQEKQASSNSEIVIEEIVATVDRFLEYKCITTKQHKPILFIFNLLHAKKK